VPDHDAVSICQQLLYCTWCYKFPQ